MKDLFDKFPTLKNGDVSIKKLTTDDLERMKKMFLMEELYGQVPTFVPEKQCNGDMEYFINTMAKELFEKRIELILGIYYKNQLFGLLELYHYDKEKKQVSIGVRLMKDFQNKSLSRTFYPLIREYLFNETDIETICASNIANNLQSGRALEKNGFTKVEENVPEDWGFEEKVLVDKWVYQKTKKMN